MKYFVEVYKDGKIYIDRINVDEFDNECDIRYAVAHNFKKQVPDGVLSVTLYESNGVQQIEIGKSIENIKVGQWESIKVQIDDR